MSLFSFAFLECGTRNTGETNGTLTETSPDRSAAEHPSAAVEAAFQRIAKIDALHSLHDGLKLFLHHFVLGRKKKDNAAYNLIQERVKLID